MRRLIATMALLGACSSPRSEATVDSGSSQDTGSTCPPPLGAPKPLPPARAFDYPLDDVLRMNHVQLEATHNSYHLRPDNENKDWAYSHVPLADQLERQGVRGVEIDVHWNDECGRFEVYHLPILDPRSTCKLFTDCLDALRGWSDAHPGHFPIFVHLEPKDEFDADVTEARLAALEHEVLAVFLREQIISPDEVKGSASSLAKAVTETGWPTLRKTRGRVLFYLDMGGRNRDVYTHGAKDLNGRLLFVDSRPGDPYAAVMVINDAVVDASAIKGAVKTGYIVRSFGEKNVPSALAGDRADLDAALADGSHVISSDFPAKVPETTFFEEIPGGTPARCNPLVAPSECTSLAIEDPSKLAR